MRKNREIAELLNEIADLLELKDVDFKPRAYRRAALSIEGLGEDIEEIAKRGELDDIPGVGESITKKIKEFLKTGKIKYLEQLKKKTPIKIEELAGIEGMGPKTIKTLYKKLKIKSRHDLEEAAKKGKISKLKGFSKKTEEKILGGITFKKSHKGRLLLGQAYPIANQIAEELRKHKFIEQVEIAGSLRRMKETIGDVDILITTKNPKEAMDAFLNLKGKTKTLAKGTKKCSIIIDKLQVDLRIVDAKSWGAALQYFSGNKQHSIQTRKLAIKKGYKLNEYGLFKGDKAIAAKTEEQIYKKLGLQYIPPELRQGEDEIELAQKKIPKLIELKDIKGDFHVHSKYSDGANSILEMAKAAKKLKRKYLLQSDHTGTLKIAHAMSTKTIDNYLKEIKQASKKVSNFTILKGAEVNIMKDGNPDLDNKTLKKFDLCIGSIHSGFSGNATKRICKAMENPHINIIGHPTGRLLLQRQGYRIDMDKICEKAKETNTALEINAQPQRLDLNGAMVRIAKEHGVKLVISTDSHNTDNLKYMRYGVGQARRGMLEKRDVLNTLSAQKVLKYFK